MKTQIGNTKSFTKKLQQTIHPTWLKFLIRSEKIWAKIAACLLSLQVEKEERCIWRKAVIPWLTFVIDELLSYRIVFNSNCFWSFVIVSKLQLCQFSSSFYNKSKKNHWKLQVVNQIVIYIFQRWVLLLIPF